MVPGRPGAPGTGRLTRGFALTTQAASPSAAFTSARLAAAPKYPPRDRALPRRGAPSSAHRGIGDSHQEPLEQRFGAPSPRPSSCWGWHRRGRGRCWAQGTQPLPKALSTTAGTTAPPGAPAWHQKQGRDPLGGRDPAAWAAAAPPGPDPLPTPGPLTLIPPQSSQAGVMLPRGCQAPKTNPVAKPLEEQRAGCLPLLPLQPGC